jgi:hypothetical protein
LAVLRELAREMGRRAVGLKRAGVTRIIDLHAGRPDVAMPRIVAVIDEFHVLFTGNDRVAAPSRRNPGGVRPQGTLVRQPPDPRLTDDRRGGGAFTKGESIFGQFPLRVHWPRPLSKPTGRRCSYI